MCGNDHANAEHTGPELSRLRDDRAVNWIMAWRITLMLSENWPVPAKINGAEDHGPAVVPELIQILFRQIAEAFEIPVPCPVGPVCQNRAIEIDQVVYHEFGHYIAMASGAIPELKPIFDAEASQMREILGDYSQTSPGEYFAECVSFWLHRPDGRDILRDNSPRMYMLIADLISDADTHAAQAA